MSTASTQPSGGAVPLFVSVPVAGELCSRPRMAAYTAAWHGDLPTVRFGKRMLVPVAKLAELAGRDITADDIAAAEARACAQKRQGDGAASSANPQPAA